jgi:type VI secretion system protein ImpL
MTRKATIWLVAILVLAAWMALSWFVPGWLAATGTFRWVLFGSVAAIGAFGAVFTAVFLTRRPPPPPAPKDPLSQEVEAALGQAERILVEGRVVKGRGLQRLPVILLLGGKGQHKTSTVAFSGAEAELLAGDVMRGVQVNPTQAINIWLARPALVVEPGVEVLQDPERRARLWHRLQPARLAQAVRSGEQAPRAVVVCASCEQFRAGAPLDAVVAYARELRQTLGELAQTYGVRLPVYVVFTAADKIPGFREYTKHLSTEEIREVLGVTLPLPEDVPASRYAEYAAARARQALGTVFRPLAERRHAVLMGLPTPGDRALAYQFPRELRKAEAALTQFLVELVRPSDLQVNPFLRGFYFSGVREVIRQDAEPIAMGAAPVAAEEAAGATALLSALPRPGATPAMGARLGAPARVPEWVFSIALLGRPAQRPVAFGVTRGTRVSYGGSSSASVSRPPRCCW